jgi:Amiloride-sensitive sodium channel
MRKKNPASCECLPACTTITFDTEISVSALNISASSKYKSIYDKESVGYSLKLKKQLKKSIHFSFRYSQITLHLKDNQFMTSERSELYGATDFLANFGGLLGLFLGVSIISLLEIGYYCTIRLWCNWKNKKMFGFFSDRDQFPTEDRNNKFLPIMKQLITDYYKKTTIQGIKYATDTNRSLIEIIWWTIVIMVSVLCCALLIFDTVRRYDQSPLIASYANEETPISQVCEQFLFFKQLMMSWLILRFHFPQSPYAHRS